MKVLSSIRFAVFSSHTFVAGSNPDYSGKTIREPDLWGLFYYANIVTPLPKYYYISIKL